MAWSSKYSPDRTASAEQGLFSFAVPGSGFFMDDTGGLPFTQGLTDALGLTTNPYIAADMASYDPYAISTGYGSASYNAQDRRFRSSLSPQYQDMQRGLFGEYNMMQPGQYLNLMRQRAAPANESAYLGMENRLFSQGRLGASQPYGEGGAMRGLMDSFANQDLGFQLSADQMSNQFRDSITDRLFGLAGLEKSLYDPLYQQGSLDVQASGNAAQAFSNQAGQNQSFIGGIFDSVLGGLF